MSLPSPSREALLALLTDRSFEQREVTLVSGAASDFYVDCKQTALHPEGAWHLGNQLLDVVEAIEAEAGERARGVGGMTMGADPLATAVSLAALARGRRLPAFIVRKTPKGHGTGQWVEGRSNLTPDAPVVLLEDVVTTGGSTARAAERVRSEGYRPLGVAVVVDREAGGMAALRALDLRCHALFTRADFFGV